MKKHTTVHRTALVEHGAELGEGVEIGPFCVIESGVVIATGTVLRSHVELRAGTVIGSGCYLDSGVKSSGDNVIENEVTLRFNAIVAKGCRVGRGTFVAPNVMTINRDHRGREIGGAAIGMDCHIGTAAVLHPGIWIADGAVVGAKALVTKSITEPGTYIGIPARRFTGGGGI